MDPNYLAYLQATTASKDLDAWTQRVNGAGVPTMQPIEQQPFMVSLPQINHHQLHEQIQRREMLNIAQEENKVQQLLNEAQKQPLEEKQSKDVSQQEEEEEKTEPVVMPWDNNEGDHQWVPCTKSGKQKSPSQIRNELQRYIDSKAETQTAILARMGVNHNSFRRFMNPKTYKNPWKALENGTYWAAAKLLYQLEQDKNKGKKRKVASAGLEANSGVNKVRKREAEEKMQRINQVAFNLPPNSSSSEASGIYDSCPQLVKKIKSFLQYSGVTKASFLRALGETSDGHTIHPNALQRFLSAKQQDQCANQIYPAAYIFFERKRLMDGASKTKARLKNEQDHPNGFSTARPGKSNWIYYVDPAPVLSSSR